MKAVMLVVHKLVAAVEAQPTAVVVSATVGALVAIHLLLRLITPQQPAKHKIAVPASSLPVLRNTLDLMFYHRGRLYDWIADECEAAGGKPWIRAVIGSSPTVIISSPELIEDILKTQFDSFHKGDVSWFSDLFGKGILAADGDAWQFHRKTASHLFSSQMTRDVMYRAVEDKMKTLCNALCTYEARDQPMAFKDVITQFTSDVFGKIGFGVDLNCLENGLEGKEGNEFVEAFATSTQIIFLRLLQPRWLWKLKQRLNVGTEKQNKQNHETINDFIYRIINESIAKKKAESEPEAPSSTLSDEVNVLPPKDLISLFLGSTITKDKKLQGAAFDSEMHLIRDTVVNFIFAGKDTTSLSMSWFIVMMNRYPEVLKEIREELRTKLPRTYGDEFEVPSMDDLPQLTYLEAAIRENLRLNPVVPISPWEAKEDVVLCDGTHLTKGTRLGLSVYSSHRMKSVWGDDALEFKPERWIDSTGKLLIVSPYKFIAFSGGRRSCIGMKFAVMEIKCTLAVLLSRFELETVDDPWKMTYETAITMGVKGPLAVKITSRSGK